MLTLATKIAAFGAFVLIAAVLTVFVWDALFAPEKNGQAERENKPAYSDQQGGDKHPLGASPSPSRPNPTDEAIASYTKWLVIFTGVLALATILLFVSGERSVDVSRRTAEAAKDAAEAAKGTLIAQSRAWISPLNLFLLRPLEQGPPVSVQLHILNTGREPGRNARIMMTPRLVDYIQPGNDMSLENLGPNTTCQGIEPSTDPGLVFYPAGEYGFPYDFNDTPENKVIFDAVSASTGSLVIEGCIAYRTSGETHKSMFRFFLRDIPGEPSFINNNRHWNFNTTGSGNDAT